MAALSRSINTTSLVPCFFQRSDLQTSPNEIKWLLLWKKAIIWFFLQNESSFWVIKTNMLTKQTTVDSFLASGYETDDTSAPPTASVPTRRSSRIITPAKKAPGMITPSSDSRRALEDWNSFRSIRDVRDAHVHRCRERSASLPGDELIREPACGRSKTVTRQSSTLKSTSISRGHDSIGIEHPLNNLFGSNQVRSGTLLSQESVEDPLGPPVVGLAQDSDEENTWIRKRKRNIPVDEDFDCLFTFFEPGFHCKEKKDPLDGPPLSYACRWCSKVVRVSASSRSNLKAHRDGHNQSGKSGAGCPRRRQAIAAGAKLPPSVSELRAQALKDNHQSSLASFVNTAPAFNNKTLNQCLAVWQVAHALPFIRIEDPILKSILYWLRPDARVFGRKWSAEEAKRLYLSLRDLVIDQELKELSSKFCLIQDVWTVKGNLHAFIGASVSYVKEDWTYVVRHLSLKVVAWHHKGVLLAEPMVAILKKNDLYKRMLASVSDSGSNNFTMAREMHRQLEEEGFHSGHRLAWNPKTMTIRCFCHKMGLIVKAGLDALGLKPRRVRHDQLGRFPAIGVMAVIEEEEQLVDVPDLQTDPDGNEIDNDDLESNHSSDSNNSDSNSDQSEDDDKEQQDEPQTYKNRKAAYLLGDTYMKKLTDDMDTVNKKLTRSSGHRADFNRRRERANEQRKIDGLPNLKALLSGHGIRWGIRAEHWERMWAARDLIDRVMRDDLAEVHSKRRRAKTDGKKLGYFEEVVFSVADWQAMRDVLDILTPFKFLTREMEGDKPTGCLVLLKYIQLKASMEARLKKMHQNNHLYPMVDVMIDKIIKYLNEALECDTLILAAVFHPGLRVKFFTHSFGMGAKGNNRAEELLKDIYNDKLEESRLELDLQPATARPRSESPTQTDHEEFGHDFLPFYNDVVTSSDLTNIERYLQGIDPFSSKLNNPQYVLDWWKSHASKYPVLSKLAQDYLATPAASAAPERSFSVAGQVCTAERGGLLPRMIEMTVSSQSWMIEDVPLAGDFAQVGKVIDYAKKMVQKKTRKSHFHT